MTNHNLLLLQNVELRDALRPIQDNATNVLGGANLDGDYDFAVEHGGGKELAGEDDQQNGLDR